MTASDGSAELPKSRLERALSLFTEVKGGEGATMLLLALNVFLILTAYYIIKPVREALILSVAGGAELKSYAAAWQSLLLLAVVPLFSWLVARLPRRVLINAINLFFAANLVAFYLLHQLGVSLGVPFYLWVGIFNLMVPALFWSFANDVYTVEQGKRLFVIVAFGASMGAVLGSKIADLLVEPLGVFQMLLVSAAILLMSLSLTNVVIGRERVALAAKDDHARDAPAEDGSPARAFKLVIGVRYLLLIALLMLFLNWVNTTGEYILGRAVKESAEAEAAARGVSDVAAYARDRIASFYAGFFTIVNITGVVLQLLLVSRIIKYLGIRVAIAVLPFIALAGYTTVAFFPVLGLIRIAKIAENATDYSLQNTVRQALFLPTTREQKYKAKQAIDTFFVRAGDMLSAGLVYLGVHQLGLTTKGFALVNVGLVVVWLVLAIAIGREYRRLAATPAA